ncbi:MAG: hypothetical protein JWQ87_5198 [Candidatus Sulfotelmatobacter sp.]|jgi:hypothetical protein|nr:hypothetical protein [Candidatus Sulfotelmatobacter sp.]
MKDNLMKGEPHMKYTKPEITPLGNAAEVIESVGAGHEPDLSTPGPINGD